MFSLITLLFTLLTGSFTYTVDLPFQTLEQPQETILDEGMHDISLEFTLDMARFDETATEEELLDILNDCFDQAGAAFISLTIDSYMGGTDSNGIMTVHIPPSTTIDDRSFIFRYNNGNSSVGFSQDGMANPPATPEEPETPVVPEEPAEPDDEDDTLETEPANYIATETYVGDGSTSITDITYYGGLGYPVQEVRTSFAGRGRDLVTGILYDNMRRPDAKVLLPYVRTAGLNSHYEPELLSAQQQYYSENGFSDGTNACKVNTYDSGESGKLRSARIEGDMHSAADKKTTFKYRLNTTEDAVKKFIYTPAAGTAAATVTAEGTHSFGNLTVVSTTDEDERTKHVFSDRNGKVVLERRIDQNDNNDTYFIYDIKDSLVCVIQPMGVNSLPRTFSFNDSFAQKYCFTYRYDAFGNIIERHVPGAGTTRYAYDIRGRLVLYADDVMSTSKLYRYIIYDQMDRVCEEGYTKINTTLDSIRNMLLSGNDITAQFSNRYILRQCTYYEVPEVPEGFMAESGVVDRSIVEQARCITLLKTEKVYEDPDFSTSSASTPYWRERTFFYDGEGRTVQIVETDLEGWTSRYSSEYDFTGNVTAYVERHTKNTSSNYIRYEYTYDDRGRVTACHRTLNGRQFAPVFYDYDELGRKVLTDCSGRIVELQSYNQQGWPQTQDVLLYGLPAFQMRLSHYDPDNTEAVPSFAGLVCEALSCHNEQEPRFMTYGYDDLGRLVWAQQEEGDREEMQYDGNGNMLSIVRRNQSTTRSQSIFAYNGNLITSSRTDGSNATYSHHSNGNLKNNSAGNLTFSYNCSNLLTAIRRGTTKVADIIHLADGTKVQVKAANGTGLVYKGKFAYSLAGGRMTMESVAHDHGRFLTDSNNEFIDTWHVTDYLGSVRAVYDITQERRTRSQTSTTAHRPTPSQETTPSTSSIRMEGSSKRPWILQVSDLESEVS